MMELYVAKARILVVFIGGGCYWLGWTGGWTISGDFDIKDWNFQRMLEVQHNQFGGTAFFTWIVEPDLKNSTRNTIVVYKPFLTLYTRDNYLNETKDDEILDACLSYMTEVGVLLGGDENATTVLMKGVLDFETKLAEIILPVEEKMDQDKIYEKMTIADLQELMPFIHWTHYFDSAFNNVGRKISASEDVVIYEKEYFVKLTELVTKYLSNPQRTVTLINYATWTVIRETINYLSKPFRKAKEVLDEAFSGSEDKEIRWATCFSAVDDGITSALSAMFIREAFEGEKKAMAESMVDKIKQVFKENLYHIDWMDPETQKRAAEKVDSLHEMIGFPDYIKYPDQVDEEYKDLEFSETDYFNNNMNVLQYNFRKDMKKLDLAPNRTEWMMSATDINAYYSTSLNHIAITAAYLQPPFYDINYPKSINFGVMGSVMGHEITHAFDDSANTLNGKTTLGENLADCGGLNVAYQAYQKWIAENHKELPLPGVPFTHNQLFFLAYAQLECSVSTPEKLRSAVSTHSHTLPKYRVIGPLSNSEDFAREFKCPSKSAMNPQPKCKIW
ncbi:endothelin-converting enzyme homolog [Trichonephila inaurata madagascariensis]|uniref:Endothelin-converting enzyme homolog n=1 Tax=Trichonephila inaurata madagascariensis TaxID=2747483 RepID=A0A8X6Y480_9ARAC|nr:endothelin-converting enzyme homolog [Trichonephila inaurata madagascariensis]